MESRDLYRQKYEAKIDKWTSKLGMLRAQSDEMTAQAQLDIKPHVDAVQAKFETSKAKLVDIAAATDERWDEVAKEVDTAWAELKAAAGGAYDALKRHRPAKS
jgi:uncharacterized coiled-coil DUF342 family protein